MIQNSKLGAARLAAIGLLGVLPVLGLCTVQVFVSPSGNDSASGLSSGTPVKSIQRAVQVVEAQRAGNTSNAATINLAAGRYQLAIPIQFNVADSNLTLLGPNGNTAVITGGVPITAWSKFIPANIRKRLSPAALNGVYSAPVPTGNLGVFQRRGGAEPGTTFQNEPAELSVNGVPMALARFPASGWASATSVAGDGVTATFNMSRRTTATADAWVQGFWSSDGWETWEPLTAASAKNSLQVSGLQTASQMAPITNGARFAIVNSLEDLNQPGQYYIDRTGNRIYFYPISSVLGSSPELSQLDGYLASGYQADKLVFKNLVMQSCRGEGVKLFGCTNSGLDTCIVRGTQLEGVYLTNGSNNFVKNSSVTDTGSCGVFADEGSLTTLANGGDQIVNNFFSNPGRMEQTCRPAVWIRGVGATVSSNTIVNCSGQGIMFDGCNHLITGNDISHTCLTMNDAGAIYTGRNLLDRGNVVSMNILHDIQPVVAPRVGTSIVVGVYLDDFSSGYTIQSNIFYNVNIGVLIGGGRSNIVDSNAFTSVTTPVWIDARGMTWYASFFGAGGEYQTQMAAMSPAQTTLFRTTYPSFANMLAAVNPALPEGNVVSHPYFPSPGVGIQYLDPSYTTSLLQASNALFNGNSIFVNPAAGNFNLVSGANVTTQLPGTAGAVGILGAIAHSGLIRRTLAIP